MTVTVRHTHVYEHTGTLRNLGCRDVSVDLCLLPFWRNNRLPYKADILSHPWRRESPTQAHSFIICVAFIRILLLKEVNRRWICESVAWLMTWSGDFISELIPLINTTHTNINLFLKAYGTWMPGAMYIGLRTSESDGLAPSFVFFECNRTFTNVSSIIKYISIIAYLVYGSSWWSTAFATQISCPEFLN